MAARLDASQCVEMSKQVRVSLNLHYDENAIEQLMRGFVSTVPVHCTLGGAGAFVVDAALRASNDTAEHEKDRPFFYLNGLLRALIAIRVRHPTVAAVELVCDKKYLNCNASVRRVAQWKKRGWKTKTGAEIKHKSLWEEFWNITRYIDVEVAPQATT